MADKIKGITVKIGGDTTELGKAITEANVKAKSLQSELKGVNTLLKGDPNNTVLLNQKQELLNKSISETKDKLKMLKEKQDEVKKAFDKNELTEEQYRDFQREIVNTETKLKSLETESQKFGSVTTQKMKQVGTSITNVGNKTTEMGNKMKTASTVAVADIGAIVKLASDFETGMAKVSTLVDDNLYSMKDMSNGVLDISNETGKAATELSEAMYQALSSSVETGHALEFTRSAAKLSKAGFTETDTAVDLLTTTLNAYRISAVKTNNISDMLVMTQDKGKTTVNELASSMGKVIPTASSLNVGIAQLCTGYSVLTKKGIQTRYATTYMSALFDELGKSSSISAKILKNETGKSFSELMKSGKSLGDVVEILSKSAKKSNTSFNDLFAKSNARKAALSLLSTGAEEFNSELKEMQNSSGRVDKALQKLETPAVKAKKSLNNLKNDGIKLGESALVVLAPAIDTCISSVKNLTSWVDGLNDGQKEAIVQIGLTVAATAPALMIIGKVTTGIGTVVTNISTLIGIMVAKRAATEVDTVATVAATTATGGFAAALNLIPFVAVITAIGFVTAGLVKYATSTDTSISKTDKLKNSVEESAEAYKKLKKSSTEQANADLSNIAYTQQLAEELQNLVDKNGNVKEAYKSRAKFILNQLNKALGTEYKSVKDVVNENGKLKESIYEVIEAKRANILLTAHEESYKTAIQNLAEAEKNEAKQAKEVAKEKIKWQGKVAEYQAAKEALAEKYSSNEIKRGSKQAEAAESNIAAYKILADKEKKILKTKKKNYKDSSETVNGYYSDINTYERASTLILKGESKKAINCLEDYGTGFKTVASTSKSSAKKQKKTLEDQVIDTEINARLMKEKYKSGVAGVTKEMVATAQKQADKAKEEFVKVGGNITDGITKGAKDKKWTLTGAMEDLVSSAVSIAKKTLGIKSPSRVMANEVGKWIPAGIGVGIESGTTELSNKIKKQMDTIQDSYTTSVKLDKYSSFGVSAIQRNTEITNSPVMLETVNLLSSKLDALIAKSDKSILLDGNKLVGSTVSRTDKALGTRQNLSSRGLPI